MQSFFYSDRLDLLKWGALVTLAKRKEIPFVLQVLFFRPSQDADRPQLHLGNTPLETEFPAAVWDNFRSMGSITSLRRKTGIEIKIFDAPFVRPRRRYFEALLSKLQKLPNKRKLVLLDPDTGISQRPSFKHVGTEEVELIWDELHPGDWLALYQHRPKFFKGVWQAQSEKALLGMICGTEPEAYMANFRGGRPFPAALLAVHKS